MNSESFSFVIKNTDHLAFVMGGRQRSFFIPMTTMVRDFPVLADGVWHERLVDLDTGKLTSRSEILSRCSLQPGVPIGIRHPFWECMAGSLRGYVWDISTKVCRSEDGDRLCGFLPTYSDWEHREASVMPQWAVEIWCDVLKTAVWRLDEVGKDQFAACGTDSFDDFLRIHGLEQYFRMLDLALAYEVSFKVRALTPCSAGRKRSGEVINLEWFR